MHMAPRSPPIALVRSPLLAFFALLALAAPRLPAAGDDKPPPNRDAKCDCKAGYGACQHWLRAPAGITADPCFCDRCRELIEHPGTDVPDGMNALCFQSSRIECYLK